MDADFASVEAPLEPPPPRPGLELGVRVAVRALDGTQKQALVASSATDRIWRLLSDEGPDLAGSDLAPPPLGLFVTGVVSAHANELRALAAARGVELHSLRLVQDTFYSMEGSALRGTMTGGALPPVLRVEADCNLSDSERLDAYRVVQDTHFSTEGGPAASVETHVFLDGPEDGDSARQMLDMGEQTCFLHALCRTDLEPVIETVAA